MLDHDLSGYSNARLTIYTNNSRFTNDITLDRSLRVSVFNNTISYPVLVADYNGQFFDRILEEQLPVYNFFLPKGKLDALTITVDAGRFEAPVGFELRLHGKNVTVYKYFFGGIPQKTVMLSDGLCYDVYLITGGSEYHDRGMYCAYKPYDTLDITVLRYYMRVAVNNDYDRTTFYFAMRPDAQEDLKIPVYIETNGAGVNFKIEGDDNYLTTEDGREGRWYGQQISKYLLFRYTAENRPMPYHYKFYVSLINKPEINKVYDIYITKDWQGDFYATTSILGEMYNINNPVEIKGFVDLSDNAPIDRYKVTYTVYVDGKQYSTGTILTFSDREYHSFDYRLQLPSSVAGKKVQIVVRLDDNGENLALPKKVYSWTFEAVASDYYEPALRYYIVNGETAFREHYNEIKAKYGYTESVDEMIEILRKMINGEQRNETARDRVINSIVNE